jgi:hypothetical protein
VPYFQELVMNRRHFIRGGLAAASCALARDAFAQQALTAADPYAPADDGATVGYEALHGQDPVLLERLRAGIAFALVYPRAAPRVPSYIIEAGSATLLEGGYVALTGHQAQKKDNQVVLTFYSDVKGAEETTTATVRAVDDKIDIAIATLDFPKFMVTAGLQPFAWRTADIAQNRAGRPIIYAGFPRIIQPPPDAPSRPGDFRFHAAAASITRFEGVHRLTARIVLPDGRTIRENGLGRCKVVGALQAGEDGIHRGMSGGAVADAGTGELLGIITYSDGGYTPLSVVRRMLEAYEARRMGTAPDYENDPPEPAECVAGASRSTAPRP